MATDASPWIDALRRSSDRLTDLVSGFTPDELRVRSMSSDWDVSQVLSHLGSGAEISLNTLHAALDGVDAPGNDSIQPIWDRWNALDPEGRATQFVATDQALVAAFESIDPATRDSLRVPLSFAPEPLDLSGVVSLRLTEHALHSWDVFAAFDPTATLAPPSVELLIDRPSPFFSYLANGGWTGEPGPIEVRTSAPDRTLTLTVGDQTSLTLAAPTDAVASVDLPAEAWLRLTAGRLPVELTPAGSSSEPAGTLERLRTLFPGF